MLSVYYWRAKLIDFGRIVLGYHGCPVERSEAVEFTRGLIAGTNRVEDWKQSGNDYDWLGRGVYFWEFGIHRARQWAGPNGEVIGALIQLGNCFDLTDPGCEQLLKKTYDMVASTFKERAIPLPNNEMSGGMRRNLDKLIMDQTMAIGDTTADRNIRPDTKFQTIRCAFEEGEEAFPGSKLRSQTHIQIAVRDIRCILGVFRPREELT